jgi:hypothetical protein
MDAHEYFVMEQVVSDRRDDAERFTLERAFHSEAAEAETSRGPATDAEPPRCADHSAIGIPWSSRQSSTQHV